MPLYVIFPTPRLFPGGVALYADILLSPFRDRSAIVDIFGVDVFRDSENLCGDDVPIVVLLT